MPYNEKGVGYRPTDTSEQAAENVSARTIRYKVLRVLRRATDFPMTADEVAAQIGLHWISVRPRMTELKNDGLIEDSGQRYPSSNGKDQIAWQIAPTKKEN